MGRERTATSAAASRLFAGAVVAGVVLSGACSSDKGDDDTGATTSTVERTTTTTRPEDPGNDKPWEVKPLVAILLQRYDEVVNQIVADPAVVRDSNDPLVVEFRALFDPDSDFAQESLDGWAEMADNGVSLKPLSSKHPVNVTYIDGNLIPGEDDEVRFAQCAVQRWVKFQDGKETDQSVDEELLAGNGSAVRVDGHWLLGELATPEGMDGCSNGSEAPT
jgi:hypothetical protein